MNNASPSAAADVLIVGGGPVGLALAGDLAWRGVTVELVEQGDGSIYQPKMDGVNVRTMEFCRRWGIAEEVKRCDYPQDFPQDMVYLTSFRGFELGRESFTTPSGSTEEAQAGVSPEVRARCPQNLFDPILQAFVGRQKTARVSYRTRFLGCLQSQDGVEVELEDLETGAIRKSRYAYIVGCDGAASSVRKALGIRMSGGGTLTHTTNVIFRCPDFSALHDKRLGYRHILIGPEGTWGTCVAINGRDQWRLSIIGTGEPRQLNEQEIREYIERTLGGPFEFEILTLVPWVRRELIADAYRKDRAFLAGDSAHVMSPTGGFGMNTGIGDSIDLSWKIAAVLQGKGGEKLLDSYEAERRPVAMRAAREASGNLLRTLSPGENPGLLDRDRNGAMLRYRVGRAFSATMLREWYKLGIDLGYSYAGSPIVGTDEASPDEAANMPVLDWLKTVTGPSAPLLREWHKLLVHMAEGSAVDVDWQELHPGEAMIYRADARPGARAPHLWLENGRSTLDLFGSRFVLLVTSEKSRATAARFEAAAKKIDLDIAYVIQADVHRAYGANLVLVRPDGHVAWRGNDVPREGVESLLDRVAGYGDQNRATITASPAALRRDSDVVSA